MPRRSQALEKTAHVAPVFHRLLAVCAAASPRFPHATSRQPDGSHTPPPGCWAKVACREDTPVTPGRATRLGKFPRFPSHALVHGNFFSGSICGLTRWVGASQTLSSAMVESSCPRHSPTVQRTSHPITAGHPPSVSGASHTWPALLLWDFSARHHAASAGRHSQRQEQTGTTPGTAEP